MNFSEIAALRPCPHRGKHNYKVKIDPTKCCGTKKRVLQNSFFCHKYNVEIKVSGYCRCWTCSEWDQEKRRKK
jgi:hypothetical protein